MLWSMTALPSLEWLRRSRTLLYDAYWPPFHPRLAYDPAEAVAPAVRLGADAIRFGTIGKWALYPSRVMPNHPDLRCAVVESPFSDYRGVIRRWAWNNFRVPHFPLIDAVLWMLRWRVGDSRIDAFNPVSAAGRIGPRPLLVIGGERDKLMPPDDVRRVFAAAHEPKQLWLVPEASHAKCREVAGLEYETRVSGFFSKNL